MPETWCARRRLRDPRIAICRRVGDRRPVAPRRPSGARGFVRMAGWPGCRFAPAARPSAGRGARPCAGRPRRCAGGGESRLPGSVGAPPSGGRPQHGRRPNAVRSERALPPASKMPGQRRAAAGCARRRSSACDSPRAAFRTTLGRAFGVKLREPRPPAASRASRGQALQD